VYAVSERVFQRMLATYERGLTWSVRHRRFTLLYSAVVLVLSVLLYMQIPKGFMPSEDVGQLSGSTEAKEGTSFAAMVRMQKEAAAVVAADPDVDAFMSSAGGRGTGDQSGTCSSA
jgi:HAE1 family hydrophobic/amphiphilic exporter-1